MGEALLAVRGLTKRYGGVTAVDDLDLEVRPGETLGVIGPNGAGKSTLVGLVSGAVPATSGQVMLGGHDVTGLGAASRTRLGIGRTHQIPRPFGGMTVLENLLLAGRHALGPHESAAATRQRCLAILDRTGLADVGSARAGGVPLLTRKRLELARALALRPRLLLLDEIGAGLVEHEVAELIDLVNEVRHEVDGVLLIEHVMDVITSCCERTLVVDFGKLVTEGPTAEVLADPQVAAVYLGTATEETGRVPVAATARQAAPAEERPLLEVTGAEASYGGVRALRGVDLTVRPGAVVALLGANGAGKTTLAHAVSGVVPLTAGRICWQGEDIGQLRPDQITAAGIAHCMEGRRIFAGLTVEENLLLAGDGGGRAGGGRGDRAQVRQRLNEVYDLFPVLADRRRASGTAMSGGQQQMLAIGRALMTGPRLVIFDEISLGLAPVAVETLYAALAGLRSRGMAMLLVEQNLERGLSLADHAYVLAHGEIALDGTPEDVRRHPALTSLYVGEAGPEATTEELSIPTEEGIR